MRNLQRYLVEALRRDGRPGEADRVSRLSKVGFERFARGVLFHFAASGEYDYDV